MQPLPSYRSTAQQAATLARLAPRGDGWRTRAGSRGYRFWTAIAGEFRRVRDLILDIVLVEAIPTGDRITSPDYGGGPNKIGPWHTLPTWESELGIGPPSGATQAERALAVVARLSATGGSQYNYFRSLCDATIPSVVIIERGVMEPEPFTVVFEMVGVVEGSVGALNFEALMNSCRPLHLKFIFWYAS